MYIYAKFVCVYIRTYASAHGVPDTQTHAQKQSSKSSSLFPCISSKSLFITARVNEQSMNVSICLCDYVCAYMFVTMCVCMCVCVFTYPHTHTLSLSRTYLFLSVIKKIIFLSRTHARKLISACRNFLHTCIACVTSHLRRCRVCYIASQHATSSA